MRDIRTYRVYVIELRCRLHCREVYVGSSALSPDERYRQHKDGDGYGASGMVRERGVRLRRDLAPRRSFMTRDAAKWAEKRTRRDLERLGYVVHGACSHRESRRCIL